MLVGISKRGFGSGLGALGVPLMSLVVPVPQAVAIMLPLLLVMDGLGLKALASCCGTGSSPGRPARRSINTQGRPQARSLSGLGSALRPCGQRAAGSGQAAWASPSGARTSQRMPRG